MHSEPNVYGWALCEDDDVRIGPDINREVEMDDSEALAWWQKVLLDLGYLLGELGPLGVSSLKTIVCLYTSTCTPGQLGKTLASLRKIGLWSKEVQATLKPRNVFKELQKAFTEKKDKGNKSPVSQTLSRLNEYIASEGTLKGRHVSTRLVAIRLANANAEAVDQYTSSSHLLQWVSSERLKKFSEWKVLLALRYLQ